MKKVLFLMFLLFLIVLETVNVRAQVRIGGNTAPNAAAALDLNAAEGTITGTKGLALPRVTLSSNTAPLDGTTANINGMLVYNTGGTLSAGVYYWNGINWMRALNNAFFDGDSIVGNEVTNATSGGGLVRTGSGTAASPFTLGIAAGGVVPAHLSSLPNAGFLWWSGTAWIPVHYRQFVDTTFAIVASATGSVNTYWTYSCIDRPLIEVGGTNSDGSITWQHTGSLNGIIVKNNGLTQGVVVHAYCWSPN